MYDLTFHPHKLTNGPIRLCMANCDKMGSLVSARLASAMNGTSSTRPMHIEIDQYFDQDYFADMGNKLAGYYELAMGSNLLDPKTVVLASAHPAALYVGEVLHAPILPMQLLSFSNDLAHAQASSLISIVGSDYGVQEFWINGHLEARRTDLNFVDAYTDYGINAVFIENYWNAGSIKKQERYFDNFVVSTERIGCLCETATAISELDSPLEQPRVREHGQR